MKEKRVNNASRNLKHTWQRKRNRKLAFNLLLISFCHVCFSFVYVIRLASVCVL